MDVDLERVFAELADARGTPLVLTVADVRCGHTLAEAEARIRWRLAWYDGLAATGWSPPAYVRAQVERDRALLGVTAADRLVESLPSDGGPGEPSNGRPVEPSDGGPGEASAGRPVEPVNGRSRQPVNGRPVEPVNGRSRQPAPPLVTRVGAVVDRSPAEGSRSRAADSAAESAIACECPVADNLREALASRAVIEQAKGMIMFAERCDPSTAFRMLVAASQRSRCKLRDVAANLVASVVAANAPGRLR